MIKIERSNLEDIAIEYLNNLQHRNRRKTNSIISYYIDEFEAIILAKPSDYSKINSQFKILYNQNHGDWLTFSKYMNNQYKVMCDKYGIWLANELNVNTCPYCNRQYTFTIEKPKKIRPQFDHFFSKSKYPHLALSFYNLIPCCSTCNHLKSDRAENLLYPYFEGFNDKCTFQVNYSGLLLEKDQIEVEIHTVNGCDEDFKDKCENNIEIFALKESYQKHSDYIEEIITKAYSYNHEYYEGLIEDFSNMGKNAADIHRLIFGSYIDRAENEKRPLSKLTSDILEQIGIRDYF